MKILVTGGTGFVGRSVCRRLAADGHSVVASTRRAAGPTPDRVAWVHVDALGPDTDWRAALHGVDAVVHLAARVHVMRDAAADPLAAFRRANTAGTLALATQARAAGVRRLVFMSSVKVNGEATTRRPFTTQDPPAPRDPYGQSKDEAEQGLWAVAGLDVVVLRPALVYGPGVQGNFLTLLGLVRRGLPLPFGAVANVRSLVGLGNLTDAVAHVLDHPDAPGRTYLVSDGEDVSTPDLIRRLAAALGAPARLPPVPPALLALAGRLFRRADQAQRLLGSLVVDSRPLRHELDWVAPLTLDQGLAETARWYLDQR